MTTNLNVASFAHGWSLLNKRFKNDCDAEIMDIYFQELKNKLSAEEFAIAVKRCILEETFFPSAKIILEKVIEKPETLAASEWDKVLNLLPNYAIAQSTNSRFTLLNCGGLHENTLPVLISIGGWKALSEGTEKDLIFLRKAFLNSFESKADSLNRQLALSGSNQKAIGGGSC